VETNVNLAEIASMIAEPSRAAILVALLDGRVHPASELAFIAKIKPQTASFHLAKMIASSMITVQKQGRHRYYRLNPQAAGLLESLLTIAPLVPVKSLSELTKARAIKQARTCCDHFAGEFGVAITDSLIQQGLLREQEEDFLLTGEGTHFFADFGMDLNALRKVRRSFSK
jgi:DNA-binding transcriptional ArsR family regulator